MAAALGQTITVVNKSGKVVSTSKHLVNVLKEAKSAYRERKAELKAQRVDDLDRKASKDSRNGVGRLKGEEARGASSSRDSSRDSRRSTTSQRKEGGERSEKRHHDSVRRSGHARSHSDSRSTHSRRHSSGYDNHSRRRSSAKPSSKPPVERGYSDSFYADAQPLPRTRTTPPSPLSRMHMAENEALGKELVRRHSFPDNTSSLAAERRPGSSSSSNIDMDLAYGELPPPLPLRPRDESTELKEKMTSLQRLLEEANCLHYSATAIIKNLEKNPDAMAAVALTLAEISNLASKLAPGALVALKGSFPAAVALLLSPEFLIAAGVGVGVTVVALGGYKIIKRVKAKKKMENETEAEELEEVDQDMSRIEEWRRGIEGVETASVATSVEGEFVTPGAAKDLRERGLLPPAEPKKDTKKSTKSKRDAKSKDLEKKEKDLEKKAKELEKKEKELEKKEQEKEKKQAKKEEKEKAKEEKSKQKPEGNIAENKIRDLAQLKSIFKKDKETVVSEI